MAYLWLGRYAFDPPLRLLLYSAFPEGCQTWLIFIVCFLDEIRFLLVLVSVAVPTMQLQVKSFDQVNAKLEDSIS